MCFIIYTRGNAIICKDILQKHPSIPFDFLGENLYCTYRV